mmetsp:Transcript_3531/g.10986  ORF Transcript_3531/g.10986 Transcript_3531/m.10986 type:complete len:260 (-) Transcript_3531:247-1026(-)
MSSPYLHGRAPGSHTCTKGARRLHHEGQVPVHVAVAHVEGAEDGRPGLVVEVRAEQLQRRADHEARGAVVPQGPAARGLVLVQGVEPVERRGGALLLEAQPLLRLLAQVHVAREAAGGLGVKAVEGGVLPHGEEVGARGAHGGLLALAARRHVGVPPLEGAARDDAAGAQLRGDKAREALCLLDDEDGARQRVRHAVLERGVADERPGERAALRRALEQGRNGDLHDRLAGVLRLRLCLAGGRGGGGGGEQREGDAAVG